MPATIGPAQSTANTAVMVLGSPGLSFTPRGYYPFQGGGAGGDPHPLFDTTFYLANCPECLEGGANPLAHYVSEGAAAGLDPHPLFDTSYYMDSLPEEERRGANPLQHYLQVGAAEGRDPHPLFDSEFYARDDAHVGGAGSNPLAHYLVLGAAEGRSPHPLFDPRYYVADNPALADRNVDPFVHFVTSNSTGLKDPHPLFDVRYYLARYPGAHGANPLVHYALVGVAAGHRTHPLFDPQHYRQQLALGPDRDPVAHYLRVGANAGLSPHRLFDGDHYLDQNPEVAEAGQNPLCHYLESGGREGDPHPLFDSEHYRRRVSLEPGVSPLQHYLEEGWTEGHDPSERFDSEAYSLTHPESAGKGLSPLEHFVEASSRDGNGPAPGSDLDREDVADGAEPVRLLAFYQPQLHPSGDAAGNQELPWTRVAAARPLFPGHRQPRQPADFGHYDLRVPEVYAEHVRYARAAGLEGFCFDYDPAAAGRGCVQSPVEELLHGGSQGFPFCLCVRGETSEPDEFGSDAFDQLLPFLRSPDYVSVGGRPLLVAYADELHDPAAVLAEWRSRSADEGLPGLYVALLQAQPARAEQTDAGPADAAVQLTIPVVKSADPDRTQGWEGKLCDYRTTALRGIQGIRSSESVLPCVLLGCDDTPLRGDEATVQPAAAPGAYREWLETVCLRAMRRLRAEHRLVFVYAWNDWRRGAYLEPDQATGKAFLDATRVAVTAVGGAPTEPGEAEERRP